MAQKEGNSILVRVAKLLRLSIYFDFGVHESVKPLALDDLVQTLGDPVSHLLSAGLETEGLRAESHRHCFVSLNKVRENAKIRNRYNQVPRTTHDTT